MEIYEVQSGDTVYGIARRYGVSPERLISDNGLSAPGRLVPGQALLILTPEVVATARRGDTLLSMAVRYHTTPSALVRNNPWLSVEGLHPGRVLTVRFTDTPTRRARINGYAYPFISETLLRLELPFLSTLTIFGYGFTEEGGLIAPDDAAVLALAHGAGVAPVLLLSSVDENGRFSSERAGRLFRSPVLQNQVLSALVAVMAQKGYRGLDIDFEYVLPEDAQAFLGFVANAVNVMHAHGYFVNVDLAPKTSAEQPGLLYEAHDYAALGALADTVLLMTYEWGYAYGPPMAVAPIGPVTNVVNFALSQIPARKILLGVPNYGYDWILPFERGTTRATVLGNEYAVTLAGREGVSIRYDTVSQAPSYTYRRDGLNHIVWFEDVRSIQEKIELMMASDLRGVGYWNLMRPFAQNWALLSVTLIPERVR